MEQQRSVASRLLCDIQDLSLLDVATAIKHLALIIKHEPPGGSCRVKPYGNEQDSRSSRDDPWPHLSRREMIQCPVVSPFRLTARVSYLC